MKIHLPKQEYEISRLKGFNDAVFAIAVTLLVLDIRPEIGSVTTNAETWHALRAALPNIGAFALSFLIIHAIWSGNNRTFKDLKVVDAALIRLNGILLFFTAILPFPAAVLAGHTLTQASVTLYAATLSLLIATEAAILRRMIKHKEYSDDDVESQHRKYSEFINACGVAGIFGLSIIVAYFNPVLATYSWTLVAFVSYPANVIANRRMAAGSNI